MYTKESIEKTLKTDGLQIRVVDALPSTNSALKAEAQNGAAEGTVLLARRQSAGRGRNGHTFLSPENTGIYMSILLRPLLPAADALRITTAAAVAVCEAIEEVCQKQADIKWVNDIYCGGKKVCGILTEGAVDENGKLSYAVLGIGLNVAEPKDGFPPELPNAGALLPKAEEPVFSRLAASVLDRFFMYYADLSDPQIHEKYARRDYLKGKNVHIVGQPLTGTAVGIDESFQLLIRTEDGTIHPLTSGEVGISFDVN